MTRLDIGEFDLLVVWTYLGAPAVLQGGISLPNQNSPEYNGRPHPMRFEGFRATSTGTTDEGQGHNPLAAMLGLIRSGQANAHAEQLTNMLCDGSIRVPHPELVYRQALKKSYEFTNKPRTKNNILATNLPGSSPSSL
jgi:hypothetical protein